MFMSKILETFLSENARFPSLEHKLLCTFYIVRAFDFYAVFTRHYFQSLELGDKEDIALQELIFFILNCRGQATKNPTVWPT